MALTDYYNTSTIADLISGNISSNVKNILGSGTINGIFAIPYQFMSTVDRRIDNTDIGRKYGDKIVSRMPLLFLTPCKQKFMEDFNDVDKNSTLTYLAGGSASDSSSDVSELIEGRGRYYGVEFDYATYFNYVNVMCAAVAYFMGIQREKVTIKGKNQKLGSIDWSDAVNPAFNTYFSAQENVVFYLNGLTEVSESFSNSTTESSLASTINGYSDTVKEIQFLLGGTSSVASTLTDMAKTATDSLGSALSGVVGTLGGGILGSLCNGGVSTILQGGKIIFPEIWQDSTYDRSYNLDIKLRSPDNDPISIFMNILVPYIHLLAMVLPREITDDPNGYTSPFLVRAFCKGMFNIDMGMITDMSVTKGGEASWTDAGVPSQIDISITIKDLYSSIYMTPGEISAVTNLCTNTALIDFLANMAGLNLAKEEIGRRTKYKFFLTKYVVESLPSRLWNQFDNKISNAIRKLYTLI